MAKQKYSRREQRLLDILPAALILVIYSFFFALTKQQKIQEKYVELENTRSTSVDQNAADQAREDLSRAKINLDRLRKRTVSDRLKIKQQSQTWRNPDARLNTVQEITEMLGQYNLSIVSQDYELDPQISEYFRTLTNHINSQSPSAPPIEYWKIELEGGYNDVKSFLAAIDLERMKTFPLTVNMIASDSNDGLHKWTILFVV